ncbi:MAG: hypothetical protein WEB59_10595 [Thermoanaerobaculia bacterium]
MSEQPGRARRALEWLRDWSVELTFLAATSAAGIWAGGRWLDTTGDPGVWLSFAQRMAQGERLYRDLYIQYGPLSPLLFSATGKPFGFSLTWYLLANWIPAIVAGLLLLAAARPFLSRLDRLALVGLIVGLSVLAPRPARMILPYSPAAVHALCFSIGAFLLMPSRERGLWRAYAAGILAGLALCAKQEIGLAAILGLCAPLVTDGKKGVAWVFRCLVGFSAAASLGVVIVLGAGASLDSLRQDSHLWPMASMPPEWRLLSRKVAGFATVDWREALFNSAWELSKLILLVSLAGLCLAREKSKKRWWLTLGPLALLCAADLFRGRSLLPQVHPICLSMMAAFAVVLLAWFGKRRTGRDFFIGFGLFAGLVALRTAVSRDLASPYSGVSHFATCLTWLLLLLCLVPDRLPGGSSSARWARLVWTLVLLPMAWYWAANGIESLREEGRVPVATPRGDIFPDRRLGNLYARIGQELRPGERALFLPETSGLDVLFGVHDASPFLGHMPGWLDAHAEEVLIRRFETRPPDVIVIFDRPAQEFGVEQFGRGFGLRLAAWIESRYRPVANLRGGAIFRPRETPVSSLPSR